MTPLRTLLDAHAIIAESLLWDARTGLLWWSDIKAPALYRLDPVTLENQRWPLPEDVGAFCLADAGREAVVALRSGIFALSLATGALERLATAEWDPVRFRFNEGACDAQGRFWVGCMCDPPKGQDATGEAPLHLWTPGGGLVPQGNPATCHNGMAWSADGTALIMSHSMQQDIFRYPYDQASGRLGNPALLATLRGPGIPDGAALDEGGAYWCANHGGGELLRFAPDGTVLHRVELPVSLPTMVAFGGPDLRTLFISSASDTLTAEQKRREPLAGALFAMEPGMRGVSKPTDIR